MSFAEEQQALLDDFYPSTAQPKEEEEVKTELVEVETDSDGATEEADTAEDSERPETDSDDASEESEEVEIDENSLVYDIDGEEKTLSEIKAALEGGMLKADYTQKTQKLAAETKATLAEREKVTEALQSFNEHIDLLAQSIATTRKEVDLDYLRDTDPSEYLKQKDLI